MGFADKTAVVAGGGGMGLQVARDLADEGAHVAILDLKEPPADLASTEGAVTYHQGDVTDEAFVCETFAQIADATGRLDYLVNTTGVLWFDRDLSCVDIDMAVWDRVLAINVTSFALTARHAVPRMKATGGGAMVHIASTDALRGDDKPQDAYGVAKAGIVRLSKSLAIQFARDGIRSNTVMPGPVHTPMQARWDDNPEALAAICDHVPLGRVGLSADIASAVLFLLSDKASYITGTELVVDGGCMAKP